MKVATKRFGELEVEECKIIKMPEGVLGFAEKRYILLTPPNLGPFCWFQAVDNPDLAFVVVDPKSCAPEYTINLTADEFDKLGLDESSEVVLLALVTMAADPCDITVNLQGPVALNPERMLAKQIVLEGGKFSTRHPFFDPLAKAAISVSAKRNCAVESISAA